MPKDPGPGWAGREIRRLDAVDSTNLEARRWIRTGAPHGAVVVAGTQTAGRGRRGRAWSSPPGTGLWLSLVLRPPGGVLSCALLPFAAALAAADACQELVGEPVQIKWPNDLLLRKRKVAGILAEIEGDAVALGIGVNVAQRAEDFPPEFRDRAGSLSMLTGKRVSLSALEAALLSALEARLEGGNFVDEYRARCQTLGRRVRVVGALEAFDGVAEALEADGALRVRDDQGTARRVLAGDVSIRGGNGYV